MGDAMKIRAKYAEFVGYEFFEGELFGGWRCPDKDCGMHVLEEYSFCPHCGRKLKFKEPEKYDMISISVSDKVKGMMTYQ